MYLNYLCDWKLSILSNKHNLENHISKTRKNEVCSENLEFSNLLVYQNTVNLTPKSYIISRLNYNTLNDSNWVSSSSILVQKSFYSLYKYYNELLYSMVIRYNHYSGYFYPNKLMFRDLNMLSDINKTLLKNKMVNIKPGFNYLAKITPQAHLSVLLTYKAYMQIQRLMFYYRGRIYDFLGFKSPQISIEDNLMNILLFSYLVTFLFDSLNQSNDTKLLKKKMNYKPGLVYRVSNLSSLTK